ncbi:uncharacterized protein I303_100766 [Kwoniella dejecticola CBS 10117]|uniref:Uncharacterized protein n=1 Tax=Kwoniella dejecticola CBS 10117 TaxID=1296121 RepID=A0A1A6AFZ2_9TREE|nr:uncharacterized protein I303_00768 [Kwoniella dejecticola CBS 10117]OBR88948.1 hypothetical protein I303_00768 [Kwoniella dejecticola CBS 10117]
MTTAGPSSRHAHSHSHSPHPHPHPTQTYQQQYRHHPYAPPSNTKSAPSSSRPAPPHRSSPNAKGDLPPSPPRSRRDGSETSSIGLGVAFGGSAGGKWWDEELPPPPASLSSILDSFRKSGEGDRELLLAILGAKKAEEERLSALIQTRLTILQARLSLHSAAASLSPPQALENGPTLPLSNGTGEAPLPVERTPSLTSSRGGGSTSSGMPSPPLPHQTGYIQPPPAVQINGNGTTDKDQSIGAGGRGYWQLPSLQSSLRAPSSQHSPNSNSDRSPSMGGERGLPLAPIREVRIDERDRRFNREQRTSGSLSPKSTGSDGSKRSSSGLEMLLDAGRVVNESAEREH